LGGRAQQERYDQGVSLSAHLIARGYCPKNARTPDYQGVVPYGYHLDATLLARFLRRKAVDAGVEHRIATVSDVEVEQGNITAVIADGERWAADFFIDCTGFRGLLIDKLREDNWDSFEDALPCNRAVAIQRELSDAAPNPYTIATALSNGWAWQIDLVNRQGTGYVYDGKRLSREQAERELREFLGDDARVLKCTHLDMKVGCRRDFWLGNCVAVGLAAGFIEPLESTGLHLINLGVGLLGTHLGAANPPQVVRDSYNRLMRGFFQDLKQFIVMHYCLTDRRDTEFWREAATKGRYCPTLEGLLELWKYKICEFHDLAGSYSTTFSDTNYRYVLYGMKHYPALNLRMDGETLAARFDELKGLLNQALLHSLPQCEYLAKMRATQAVK
jgi:tryptophan halogenase